MIVARKVTVFPEFHEEPVDVENLKQNSIRLPSSNTLMDAEFEEILTDARALVENRTNRYWARCTVELLFDYFPSSNQPLALPIPDVQSLVSITYLDQSFAEQTLTGATLDAQRNQIRYSGGWPFGQECIVTVTAAPDPADVPEAIRRAIRLVAVDLFENKGAQLPYSVKENAAVELALGPYISELGI